MNGSLQAPSIFRDDVHVGNKERRMSRRHRQSIGRKDIDKDKLKRQLYSIDWDQNTQFTSPVEESEETVTTGKELELGKVMEGSQNISVPSTNIFATVPVNIRTKRPSLKSASLTHNDSMCVRICADDEIEKLQLVANEDGGA